jgi:hypothetical protein
LDLGAILLLLSVLVVVGFVIARPFFDHKATAASELDRERSALLAEREQVLDALQELDFDFTLGKIAEEDYPAQRAVLLQRGSEVLQRLDAFEAKKPGLPVSDAVEKAIADRRAAVNGGPRQPVAEDDEIERLVAARKRELAGRPAGFCHQCGQAIHQSDKFCSKCGALLN